MSKVLRPFPLAPIGLVLLGLGLLSAPSGIEGAMLLPISPGHGLSVLDTVALVPLLAGTGWLYLGLWERRVKLTRLMAARPALTALMAFLAGIGLGLLVASVFSMFFWWWAIGAALVGFALAGAVIAALD